MWVWIFCIFQVLPPPPPPLPPLFYTPLHLPYVDCTMGSQNRFRGFHSSDECGASCCRFFQNKTALLELYKSRHGILETTSKWNHNETSSNWDSGSLARSVFFPKGPSSEKEPKEFFQTIVKLQLGLGLPQNRGTPPKKIVVSFGIPLTPTARGFPKEHRPIP